MEIIQEEKWKPLPKYTHRYFVSTQGRIMAVFTKKVGSKRIGVRQVIRPCTNGKYLFVQQTNCGRRCYIHRIVAIAFIPVPSKYEGIPVDELEVDHIDGDTFNNTVENLRWCLPHENFNFPLRRQRISEARKGKQAWNKGLSGVKHKNVVLIGIYGNSFYNSPKEAAMATKTPIHSVYRSAYLCRETRNGLKFRYC